MNSSSTRTTHHPLDSSQSSSLGESLIGLDSPCDTRAQMPANIPSFTLDVSTVDTRPVWEIDPSVGPDELYDFGHARRRRAATF